MIKRVVFLVFILAFPYFLTFAQPISDITTGDSAKEYLFTIKSPSKKIPSTATLKLSERKNLVYLYFEGSGLQSGKYKVFKAESCPALAKQVRSKNPLNEVDELYSVETTYGNISGERNLPFKNFKELGMGNIVFALIKIENKNKIIVSCTQ